MRKKKVIELNIKNLNSSIRYWRDKRDTAKDDTYKLIAECYIDAFQTVRINHGLEPLSKKERIE